MAASWTEFWCNASTGSNLNSGSTTSGTPAYTASNGGWNSGTGVFTPTSGNPSLSVAVGDFAAVHLDAATVTVFVARVTAVNATTITVSTTAKSGTAPTTAATGISCVVGGCWKGPNGAENFPFGFVAAAMTDASSHPPRVNFKNNATYAVTAAVSHSISGPARFEGYASSAGDGGRFVLDGGTSGASYALLTLGSANLDLVNAVVQNNGATGSAAGFSASNNECFFAGVVVNSVRGNGFLNTGASCLYLECEAYSCNQSNTANLSGFQISSAGCDLVRCFSHDNAGGNSDGFRTNNAPTFIGCVADSNGANGFLAANAIRAYFYGCVASGNASDGVELANVGAASFYLENCVLSGNGGYGVNGSAANARNGAVVNCAFYGNTSGQTTGLSGLNDSGTVTLSGAPFVDAANGDFRLNSTAGAGAACRQAGRGAFTQTAASYAGTAGYPDIGAADHLETGGGSGYSRGRVVNATN